MTTVDDRPAAEQERAQQEIGSLNSPIVSAGAATSEGGQELQPRSTMSQKALMRESGSVLRMSESSAAALAIPELNYTDNTAVIAVTIPRIR